MLGRITENGEASVPFPVTTGVKQGYVLAPTLFSLLLAQMLDSTLSQSTVRVNIHYQYDGNFFNLCRLQSHTKASQVTVRDYLFADDCALAAHFEKHLQELANCFTSAAKAFGLTVSIKKTAQAAGPKHHSVHRTSPWMVRPWTTLMFSSTLAVPLTLQPI